MHVFVWACVRGCDCVYVCMCVGFLLFGCFLISILYPD